MNDNVYSQTALINLNTFTRETMENSINSEFPSPRGFHQMKKFGIICVLYGGKTSIGENFSDLWQFNINALKWVKINDAKQNEVYLFRYGHFFTTISGTERLVIYGGENGNKEINNDLIIFDIPVCTTNESIFSNQFCLPCTEGYILNKINKCEQCLPGTFHSYQLGNYIESVCENCPIATFNNELAAKSKSKCRICGLNTFNDKAGSSICRKCPKNKLCLSGKK